MLKISSCASPPSLRTGGKNTQENYIKKILMPPDNHNGVITHLESDIMECKVKWALENITTHKATRRDGIPVELFQILTMMLWKCCIQYASKFGKLSSGHKTGKVQFSFQSQRKAMTKNVQATTQLHSPHTLAWRRKWQSTPVFLPRESQGQRSLVGCSLWDCTEFGTTEVT